MSKLLIKVSARRRTHEYGNEDDNSKSSQPPSWPEIVPVMASETAATDWQPVG